jgi:hypothetical protein
LGGTTPIHLPKSPLVSTSSFKQLQPSSSTGPPPTQHRGGSAASVFRGRIDSPTPSPTDKDSPENILMSMRTPSTSFEEMKEKATSKIQKTETLGLDQSPPSNNSQQITSLFEVRWQPLVIRYEIVFLIYICSIPSFRISSLLFSNNAVVTESAQMDQSTSHHRFRFS